MNIGLECQVEHTAFCAILENLLNKSGIWQTWLYVYTKL